MLFHEPRLSYFVLAVLASSALTLAASADDAPRGTFAGRIGHAAGLGRLRRCLASLDLTADQKSAISAIFSDARSSFSADVQTVRADRQKLRSDIQSGADKCVIGQDALTAHADAAKVRTDAQSVRDQVLSKLSTDQQNKVNACLQESGAGAMGRRWRSGA